jgi:hypothetical protein
MNMLVERGPVPITSANDEIQERRYHSAVVDLVEIETEVDEDAPTEYDLLRREACAIHVIEWQMRQLEVAAKIGIGPPRSL